MEEVKECEGEGNRQGAPDESKDTLRIKKTGCADLFDIFFFQNKIAIVLGLEASRSLRSNRNKSPNSDTCFSSPLYGLCRFCASRQNVQMQNFTVVIEGERRRRREFGGGGAPKRTSLSHIYCGRQKVKPKVSTVPGLGPVGSLSRDGGDLETPPALSWTAGAATSSDEQRQAATSSDRRTDCRRARVR